MLLAATQPDLVRCLTPVGNFGAGVWILTTAELKAAPRVRALIDFITPNAIARSRRMLQEAERREAAG